MFRAFPATGLFVSLFIVFGYFYYVSYFKPQSAQRVFLSSLCESIQGKNEVQLATVIPSEWDQVRQVVQIDDSRSEGSIEEILKGERLGDPHKKVSYWPRPLQREYESAFIFSSKGQITDIIRLDTRELDCNKTAYHFSCPQDLSFCAADEDAMFSVSDKKPVNALVKQKTALEYTARLVLRHDK